MFDFSKWLWVIGCFVVSGCATLQENNKRPADVQNAIYWYQLGQGYREMESYAEAIKAYEKALEFDSGNHNIYNMIGVSYSVLGEHGLAVKFIKDAIQYEPKASNLHNNLGFAYFTWERTSEAIGAYSRALVLDPENLHARQNLKAAYEKIGCVGSESCGQWQEPN